ATVRRRPAHTIGLRRCLVNRALRSGSFGLLALFALRAVDAQPTPPSAREIMERNFFVTKVTTLRLDLTMTLINDRGQRRERRNTTIVKLQPNGIDSKFLVRFSYPPDVTGTGLLQ